MPHFIFIQQISVLNILNMLYNLHFFSSKCRLFHNATLVGFCITHILNTGCAKIWKKKSVAKRLILFIIHVTVPSTLVKSLQLSISFLFNYFPKLNIIITFGDWCSLVLFCLLVLALCFNWPIALVNNFCYMKANLCFVCIFSRWIQIRC